jgi:N-acetylneuraminic acid mutarotase
MATARAGLAAAVGLDGKIYALGGFDCNGVPVASVEVYDPSLDQWSSVAPMPTPRALLAAATVGDTIYAIGGINIYTERIGGPIITDILSTVEVYDPSTDTWTTFPPMATARAGLAAVVGGRLDPTIYALGGNNDTSTFLDTAEAFDHVHLTWRTIAPMPTARRNLAAAVSNVAGIEGKIFAIGGHGVEFPLTTVEFYTP